MGPFLVCLYSLALSHLVAHVESLQNTVPLEKDLLQTVLSTF